VGGGRKEYHSSKFIRHLHKSYFVHDPFSHIVRLHFMLQIILHLIHLWVLSFTFRKCFFIVWTLSQPSVGEVCTTSFFILHCIKFFLILIFFSHFPLTFASIHNFFLHINLLLNRQDRVSVQFWSID